MPLPRRGGLPSLDNLPQEEVRQPQTIIKDDTDFSPVNETVKSPNDTTIELTDSDLTPIDDTDEELPQFQTDTRFFDEKDKKKKDKVDKKNKRVLPTGHRIKEREVKAVDKRKNVKTGLKVFRAFVYLIILGLFGLGIKNTFFPGKAYSDEEIMLLAQQANGDTGFPLERGKAFAEEFIKYYLNYNTDDKVNAQILSRFYSGSVSFEGTTGQQATVSVFNGNLQKILTEPIAYDYYSPLDYVGVYKVTALVTDENGSAVDTEANLTAHWVSFSVNVYYDAKKDTLSVTKDSPTLIPSYEISNSAKIPQEGEIGTGETDDTAKAEMLPTIIGYLKAYAQSSVESHSDVIQYIPKDYDVSLVSGFGDSVVLAGEESGVKADVYKSNNDNEWKVNLTVQWQDNKSTDESKAPVYTARYVMTVQSTTDNKFVVTKFSPYIYTIKE